MNNLRKRTSRRSMLKAKILLAKMKVSKIEANPPFFNKIGTYSDAFYNKNYKYILLKSGRGAGKSFWAVQIGIEESFNEIYRNKVFIYARELQTSIKDSLYSLCKSLIGQAFLNKFFIIKNTTITNKLTGVEFSFIGLRSTGGKTAFSQVNKIKGKTQVAILFADEAQDLTIDTLNVLFPTVNRGSSTSIIHKKFHEKKKDLIEPETKLIFMMNPNFDNDPILLKIKSLIGEHNERGVIIHLNIFDIPKEFQDKQLLEQAKREEHQAFYRHVWLGEASDKISGYPWVQLEEVRTTDKPKCYCAFLDPSFKGGDKTGLSFIGTINGELCIWGLELTGAWNREIDKIVSALKEFNPDFFYYEDNGLGSVPEDLFAELGVKAIAHCSFGNKENRIYKVASYTAHRTKILTNYCNDNYVNSVLKYNEDSKYDDSPDSLASVFIKSGIISDKMKF